MQLPPRTFHFYPRSPCGERLFLNCNYPLELFISIHALLAESDIVMAVRLMFNLYFYPRSPCGERLAYPDMIICTNVISIHALLAESDANWFDLWGWAESFLSTLSLRRATSWPRVMHPSCLYFYPRSPCGERQRGEIDANTQQEFLSTLSLRRATREPTALRTPHHRFLSTLSLRRATTKAPITTKTIKDFYPRSPCGERPHALSVTGSESQFLSTLSLR